MDLQLRRVMLFVDDVEAVTAFYEHKLGLRVVERGAEFSDLDAGAVRLAVHKSAGARPGRTKLCFFAVDVSAARAVLVERGVKMGKDPGSGPGLRLCDGEDPAGNVFQLSNRA
jgi:catechol 2,3-dioxygenase-like lactoylglutathione lyase family enzyme